MSDGSAFTFAEKTNAETGSTAATSSKDALTQPTTSTSKVTIPADGENVKQQFSLKAPVEEKNLLALHNLTEKNLLGRQHTPNFNPRPPRGGRLPTTEALQKAILFQSTPPARGATSDAAAALKVTVFQSTPPARGGDRRFSSAGRAAKTFQSTPPARGATLLREVARRRPRFQSTPPARGATIP